MFSRMVEIFLKVHLLYYHIISFFSLPLTQESIRKVIVNLATNLKINLARVTIYPKCDRNYRIDAGGTMFSAPFDVFSYTRRIRRPQIISTLASPFSTTLIII